MKKTILLALCAVALAGCGHQNTPSPVLQTNMATWSDDVLVDNTLGVTCFTNTFGEGGVMGCVSTRALKAPVDPAKVRPVNLLTWSRTILLDDTLGTVCFTQSFGAGGTMGCVAQSDITPRGMELIRNLLAASHQAPTH